MTIMQYEVTNLTQIDYGATGEKEVIQNVGFILSTMKYSCPMDVEFGWEPDLDSPINAAAATNASRIVQAIQENEPRAVVEEIRFEGNFLNGELKPIVKVVIVDAEV
jgi:uncharacterized protein